MTIPIRPDIKKVFQEMPNLRTFMLVICTEVIRSNDLQEQ